LPTCGAVCTRRTPHSTPAIAETRQLPSFTGVTSVPAAPARKRTVIDIGCGRGQIVRFLQLDGFDAEGIDISPEQAALARAAGVARIRQKDFRASLAAHPAQCAAIATENYFGWMLESQV
jgi:SAM-dependent methyltransferase